jgi:hypothetical protein
MDSKFVVLRWYPAMIHADLARSALEAYGIEAGVSGGLLSPQGVRPGHEIALMVREEDVQTANEILGPEETFSS